MEQGTRPQAAAAAQRARGAAIEPPTGRKRDQENQEGEVKGNVKKEDLDGVNIF
jgi:hypothetical protein